MCKNRAAGDTHTEDVQAHSSFNTLLVGEVIPGELVDRCRENTHKGEQMYVIQVREEDILRDSSKQTLKIN